MANLINIGGGAGGSSGGGHTILDNSGTSLTQRTELQFKGAYSEDNSTDGVTEVNVVRSMTKAEFDLLSNDEKVGIINVTDESGSASGEGAYIDTNTVIQAQTAIPANTDVTYTATQDCVVVYYINIAANSMGVVSVDGVQVGGGWATSLTGSYGCVFLATGQTITLRQTYTTEDGVYTVYGVLGGSSGHSYSTTEHIVGTWIDGSTIYEKTIVGDDTYNQQFNYIPHGITNLDKIIDYFGYCYYGDTDFSLIPYLRGNTYITVTVWDSTNIRVERTGLSSSFTGVRLVIRYTKSST